MILYHWPRTRSDRPLWLLEELGIEYEIKKIDIFSGAGKNPEYRHINPSGTIPTLDDDGFIIYEAGAICTYLSDKYPEFNLCPQPGTQQRALYYQWLFFVSGTLEPPLWQFFYHTVLLPEPKRLPQVIRYSTKLFFRAAKTLEAKLSTNQYILGEGFSTADIMLCTTLQWFPELLKNYPALQDYCNRLMQRPAYHRMLKI